MLLFICRKALKFFTILSDIRLFLHAHVILSWKGHSVIYEVVSNSHPFRGRGWLLWTQTFQIRISQD